MLRKNQMDAKRDIASDDNTSQKVDEFEEIPFVIA